MRMARTTNTALASRTLAFCFGNQLRFTKIAFKKHMMLIRLDESDASNIIRKLIGIVMMLLGCLRVALCMPVAYRTGKEMLQSFISYSWVKMIQDRTITNECKNK